MKIIERSAEFSECEKYRYVLTRIWDTTKPIAQCIGLNPSRAGSDKDDPTIRTLVKSLDILGFGGLKMTNLYSFIASKPKDLLSSPDPAKFNDEWLRTVAMTCQVQIFCWGSFKNIEYRAARVKNLFPDALCFGKNADGSPQHPMALMYQGVKPWELKLEKYSSGELFTNAFVRSLSSLNVNSRTNQNACPVEGSLDV
jgi:hypothetical protein